MRNWFIHCPVKRVRIWKKNIRGYGMSNKLVKHQEQKEILTGKQKKKSVLGLSYYFDHSFRCCLDKYIFDI